MIQHSASRLAKAFAVAALAVFLTAGTASASFYSATVDAASDATTAIFNVFWNDEGHGGVFTMDLVTDITTTGTITTSVGSGTSLPSGAPPRVAFTGFGMTNGYGPLTPPVGTDDNWKYGGFAGGGTCIGVPLCHLGQYVVPITGGSGDVNLIVSTSALAPAPSAQVPLGTEVDNGSTPPGTILATHTVTPEPSGLVLLGFGLAGVAFARRRSV